MTSTVITPYQPAVTIVVTTYNSEKYIRETIASLQNQDYANLEILISDDASSDSTVSILNEINAHDPRITLNINPVNIGIAKNYNHAINSARGEMVIGISHDDLLPPHHVSCMIKHFKDPTVGLVHCNAMRIDADGKEIRFVAKDNEKIRKSRNPMKWLCFNNFIQSCGLMFRKQAFLDFGGWDESFSYDSEWYTYIRYAEKYRFVYTTETYSYYRVHDSNISKYLKSAKRVEFEAYRERCRALAISKAELSTFDHAMIRFKILRKKLRPAIGYLLKRIK